MLGKGAAVILTAQGAQDPEYAPAWWTCTLSCDVEFDPRL